MNKKKYEGYAPICVRLATVLSLSVSTVLQNLNNLFHFGCIFSLAVVVFITPYIFKYMY